MPQLVFFLAQLVGGVGGSLYYTLGVSYIDDNVKKSKTPALISLSYFLRMLGPAIGYSLASACLKLYISPSLHPTVSTADPRWLGAWWLGWIVLGGTLAMFAVMLGESVTQHPCYFSGNHKLYHSGMFPKVLPRAAARKQIELERLSSVKAVELAGPEKPSFRDMIKTFTRLLRNPTLMFNNFASVFYFFGYMPYWIFTPKYIEIQYHQSASTSSLVTGTVALAFSACGVLLSGIVISKFKPRARYMAAWNVLVGAMSVAGMISYTFLGCPAGDNNLASFNPSGPRGGVDLSGGIGNVSIAMDSCFGQCRCDYVKYSPVCGQEDGRTYISACHAGCRDQIDLPEKGAKIFTQCSCIEGAIRHKLNKTTTKTEDEIGSPENPRFGTALPGPCPVDCQKQFYLFLAVMCFIKFTGATGRATNFLVSVRYVQRSWDFQK